MAVPIRMCAGCRQRAPQPELVRLAWQEGTGVVVDVNRRAPGRGVNLHPGCAGLVLRNRGVGRGLRRDVDGEQVRALLGSL